MIGRLVYFDYAEDPTNICVVLSMIRKEDLDVLVATAGVYVLVVKEKIDVSRVIQISICYTL